MKLEKAIKLLEGVKESWPIRSNAEEHYKALKLGIEALKREVVYREEHPFGRGFPLPGETKD